MLNKCVLNERVDEQMNEKEQETGRKAGNGPELFLRTAGTWWPLLLGELSLLSDGFTEGKKARL